MKLQRAFFLVIALVFLISATSAVSEISKKGQQAAVTDAATGPSVQRLMLINADTDQQIGELTNGYIINTTSLGTANLNIEALTSPATVGSVRFVLDSNAPRIENVSPYAYAGDNSAGDFNPFVFVAGNHTLSVTAYTGGRASGTPGVTRTITFTVESSGVAHPTETNTVPGTSATGSVAGSTGVQSISSFTLMNAETNQEIRQIEDNDIINLSGSGTTHLAIRANSNPAVVGSVALDLNGTKKIENLFPYTLPAGTSDDYVDWDYTVGQQYTLTATPYTLAKAKGTAGIVKTIHFTVVESQTPNLVAPGTPNTPQNLLVTTIPSVGCLNAVVTNDPQGGANPGSVTVSWNAVSGYPQFKWSRIKNGTLVDEGYSSGTGYTTNYLTPGTWSIKIAAYNGTDWGPESIIGNLLVSATGPASTSSTTCTPTGTTTDVSITTPSGIYVDEVSSFQFSVTGTPTSDQITSVIFSGSTDGTGPVLPSTFNFGSDNTPPFSVSASFPERGIYSLRVKATLQSGAVISKTKQIFVTDYPMTVNTATPTFQTTNTNCCPHMELTEDVPATVGYTTTIPSGVTFRGIDWYDYGGLTAWGGTGITYLGSSTNPNGNFTFTIAEPGRGLGPNGINNRLIGIAFFSNTVVKIGDQIRVASNPNEGQSSISNIQIIKGNGTGATNLTAGMQINIGNQNGGWGPAITFKANTTPAAVGSVKFAIDNGTPFYDNTAPYSAFGDTGGTYSTWPSPTLGAHTLVATPYSGSNGSGVVGTPSSTAFVITNGDDLTPPSVPQGLTVTYKSGTEARLSWTASTGSPTAYKVSRTPGTITTLGNITTFTDTTLTAGTSYGYVVTALDAVGNESGVSTSVVPPTLSTTYVTGNNVIVTGSSAVTPKVTPDGANASGNPQNPNATGTILSSGSIYYNGVFWWNVNFTAGADGWVSQNTLDFAPVVDTTAPNNVTGLTVGTPTVSTLNLNWSVATDNAGGSGIAGYKVYRSTTQTGTYTYIASSLTNSYQNGGLTAGTTYWYKVTAIDVAGNESVLASATAASGATSAAQTAPNAPANLTGTPSSSATIDLSWNASSVTNETGFEIQRAVSTDSGFTSPTAVTPNPGVDATSASATGLSPSTGYYFRARAVNATGSSAWVTSPLTTTQAVVTGSCNHGTNAPGLPGSGGDLSRTNGANKSVQMSSAVTGANQITICWGTVAQRTISGSISVYRKSGYSSTSWTTLSTSVANTATSYVDNTVTPGTYYEYKVSFNQTSNTSLYDTFTYQGTTYSDNTSGTAAGYIATGINVPEESYRGKMALVIDNSMVTGTNGSAPTGGDSSLMSKVVTLMDDLNADRWNVYPIYVGRGDTVASVKALIVAQNPAAIYLLGHVPVDKSFTMYPDGHGDQIPWSSDAYYSVSGTYTTTALPIYEFGRVDAFKMEVFGATNPSSDTTAATTGEKTVIGNYLDKVHSYKIGGLPIQQRAIIKDVLDHGSAGFTSPQNATVGAWATFPSIVGLSNTYITNDRGTLLTPSLQAATDTYLLMIAQSGGQCDRDNDASTGTSAGFAAINGGAVFNMAGGSRFGSFDNCMAFRENNFLKAIMFGGKGMVSLYSLDHNWYLHSLAMGQNIGYATKMSMNNHSTQLYTPVSWYQQLNYNAFMSPLGDPSIRASYFTPPSTLTVSNSGGIAQFTWSPVSGAEGYNVYKITPTAITKLNSSMVTGTSYSGSETFVSGTKYMVTAIDLTTSGSGGTYYRESLGKIYTTTGGGGGDVLAPTAPGNFASSNIQPTSVTLTWTASIGNPVGESITYKVMRSTSTNGTYSQVGSTITTSPYTLTDTGLTSGATYYYRVVASDLAGNTATSPSATTGLTVITTDNQAPDAPAGLMATASNQTSITLNWNDSGGHPAGETVMYKVFRNSGGTTAVNTTTPVATGLTTSDAVIGSLTAGTTYKFQVAAYDAVTPTANQSALTPASPNEYAAATASAPTAPLAPSANGASAITSSGFTANWTASVGATGYKLDVSTSSTFASFLTGYNNLDVGSNTSSTITGLNASTPYYYQVRAYNATGTSPASSTITASTIAAGGGSGQVLGLMGYAGPNNTEDVTPSANPYGVTDYFLDCAAGNDASNGTTAATAWRTVAKFNTVASSLQPGSRLFIKRGTTCYTSVAPGTYVGVLNVSASGTAPRYIEYRAYGSGAAPVISGAKQVTGWSAYSGNIYRANIGTNLPIRYLYSNDAVQTLARTPNKTGTTTEFLFTDSIQGQSGPATKITDSAMPNSSTNNLVGGNVFYRHDNFTWITAPITAHSGTQLTLATSDAQCYSPVCPNSIYPELGWGYVIENKLSLLDTAGEWYYDKATGYVYFWAPGNVNPSTLNVEVPIQENGLSLVTNIKYFRAKNLVFDKYNYTLVGAAVAMTDYTGAPGVSYNSIENLEIKNSYIGVRNAPNSTDPTKGNKLYNSYIHDIHNIGIQSYGYGNLYQGNVIENVGLQPELGADTDTWNHFYGFNSQGGNSDFIGNIVRNIGYIGINLVDNGEIRGNLIENISMKLNDGCALCFDGQNGDASAKRNVIRHAYGNLDGVPSNFVHATALSGGISTGDRHNIDGFFEENVVSDFGNSGIALDNNFLSRRMTIRNNTIYTTLPGNTTGATGLKFMDQSVGVAHPPAGSPCSGSGCFVSSFGHMIYGNKVYMLNSNNHTIHETHALYNGTVYDDYGTFYGNYLFAPWSDSTITQVRNQGFKTGDVVWALQVITARSAPGVSSSVVGTIPVWTKGYILGPMGAANGSNWWQVDFNGYTGNPAGVTGYAQEYMLAHAKMNVAEWQTYNGEPPAGQAQNTAPGYTISNSANYPQLYVNDTGSPITVNIGSGKCDSSRGSIGPSVTLAAFGDAIVPENCADQNH